MRSRSFFFISLERDEGETERERTTISAMMDDSPGARICQQTRRRGRNSIPADNLSADKCVCAPRGRNLVDFVEKIWH